MLVSTVNSTNLRALMRIESAYKSQPESKPHEPTEGPVDPPRTSKP